jgi:hypothetical protein
MRQFRRAFAQRVTLAAPPPAVLSADRWRDDVALPTFELHKVWTRCGIIGADGRPNLKQQSPRESLAGVQWRS